MTGLEILAAISAVAALSKKLIELAQEREKRDLTEDELTFVRDTRKMAEAEFDAELARRRNAGT